MCRGNKGTRDKNMVMVVFQRSFKGQADIHFSGFEEKRVGGGELRENRRMEESKEKAESNNGID